MNGESTEPGNPASATEVPAKHGTAAKRTRALFILILGGILFTALGLHWWLRHQTRIETDNAFIEAHIHPVASRVGGSVVNLAVKDNQQVSKGDLLLEIDPADYRVQLEKAAAEVQVARNESNGESSQVAVSEAALRRAAANAEQAKLDLDRGKALYERDVIPREQLDRLETAYRVTAARLVEAEEQLRKDRLIAGINSKGGNAKVRQKEALLADAGLKLSYTRIHAAADGFITRRTVEKGNIVQPGQPLMALVPLNDSWVTANYKESQLTHIRAGQKVEFRVDAYPGRKFTGRVESIMAGTGAAFSLLPPENATGNYVKVVQRIPVKIAIDRNSDPDQLLRVGMSVVPVVLVERKFLDILRDMVPFM